MYTICFDANRKLTGNMDLKSFFANKAVSRPTLIVLIVIFLRQVEDNPVLEIVSCLNMGIERLTVRVYIYLTID